MAKIVTLKDHKTNELAYPQTVSDAVYMDNGSTLEQYKESVSRQFANYPNVTVNGTVTNLPDNEDIRETEQHTLQLADRNNLEGMGYVILRKGKSFASQMTQTNTIYEIRYDFDLDDESVTIPANCVLSFCGGSLSEGTVVLQDTEIVGTPILNAFLSGTIKTAEIFQKWFDTVDRFLLSVSNTTGYNTINFESGDYYPTVKTTIKAERAVSINGNGCRLLYDYGDIGAGAAILIKPTDMSVSSFTISEAIDKDKMTFEVADASGLNVGDVIAVRDTANSSFSWYRNYQKGEFAIVTKIEGTTITINRNLSDSYGHTGNLYAYKFNLINVQARDFKVIMTTIQNNATTGVRIDRASANFSNVSVSGFEICMYLRNHYNSIFTDCVGDVMDWVPETYSRVSYGMMIGNSQGVQVVGGTYKGGNHGISVGGGYDGNLDIINRFIVIDGVNAANVEGGFIGSINTHGNIQHSVFRNNWCNGIYFGGKDMELSGNHVFGLFGTELANFNHIVRNNVVDGYFTMSMSGMRMNDDAPYYSGSTYDNFTRETERNNLIISGNVMRYSPHPYYTGSYTDDIVVNVRWQEDPDPAKWAKYHVFDKRLLYVKFTDNIVMNQVLQFKLYFQTTATYSDFEDAGHLIISGNEFNSTYDGGTVNHQFYANTIDFYNNKIDDIHAYDFYCCQSDVVNNNVKFTASYPNGFPSFWFRIAAGETINVLQNVINADRPMVFIPTNSVQGLPVSGQPYPTVTVSGNQVKSLTNVVTVPTVDSKVQITDNRILGQIVSVDSLITKGSSNTSETAGVIDNNADVYRTSWPISSSLNDLVPSD